MLSTTHVKSKMDIQGRRRRVRRTGCRLTTHDDAITKQDNVWSQGARPNADGERPLEKEKNAACRGEASAGVSTVIHLVLDGLPGSEKGVSGRKRCRWQRLTVGGGLVRGRSILDITKQIFAFL